jgi:DNA invertase Pin-like site-specific DNA recombinase
VNKAYAIYARSAVQSLVVIEDQVRAARDVGSKLGAENGLFIDDGEGSKGACPGRQAMMKAAQLGEFQHVVMSALDRLSRDKNEMALLVGALNAAGVEVHTPDGAVRLSEVIGQSAADHLARLLSRDALTLDVQIAECRAMAARLGYELVAIDRSHGVPTP